MKTKQWNPRIPIDEMTQDEYDICVDYIIAVEFGMQEWWGIGRELTERGITLNDALENESGRVAEIINRLGLCKYDVLAGILLPAAIAKRNTIIT